VVFECSVMFVAFFVDYINTVILDVLSCMTVKGSPLIQGNNVICKCRI
jgi:hypothetical protein